MQLLPIKCFFPYKSRGGCEGFYKCGSFGLDDTVALSIFQGHGYTSEMRTEFAVVICSQMNGFFSQNTILCLEQKDESIFYDHFWCFYFNVHRWYMYATRVAILLFMYTICDVICEKGPYCGRNIIGPDQTPRIMRGV